MTARHAPAPTHRPIVRPARPPRPSSRSLPARIRALAALPLATLLAAAMHPAPARPGPGRAAPIVIGRLHYGGGGDWYANPSSLPNLIGQVNAGTTLRVAAPERVVRLTDPGLWDVAFLHMTGHGNVRFDDAEARQLRRWLERGGFLHADDNYGMDESFRREIARVFPDLPLVEVPLDHPIYHVVYDFPDGLPKVHEHDGLPAQGFGVFLGGRLAVFYSYQCDLGDGWEDPDVHGDPPAVREAALRMGVNLVTYAVISAPGTAIP